VKPVMCKRNIQPDLRNKEDRLCWFTFPRLNINRIKRRQDIQHNDIEHIDTQHYGIYHNDIQHNDIQHNNK